MKQKKSPNKKNYVTNNAIIGISIALQMIEGKQSHKNCSYLTDNILRLHYEW
jgi:hypothetical protein